MSHNLISQSLPPEGQRLEYKLRSTRPEILARVIAAFANTEGGKIIVGVNDDGLVVGLTEEEIGKTQIAVEKALDSLRPRPLLNLHLEEIDGKNLMVIEVPKASVAPVLTENGRLYVRSGATNIVEEETLIHALVNAVFAHETGSQWSHF